jgi:glycosyltransferase involved in cell wall biosynthesis
VIAGEADLRHSPFFKKYFSFISQFLIVPFVLRPRYKNIQQFAKRKNKAVVLGIVSTIDTNDTGNKDYYNFFHTDTLHTMRKLLYEKKDNLIEQIDIKLHKEDIPLQTGKMSNFISKLKRIVITPPANPYLRYDIVKEYNNYKMAVVPEENPGIPSVNFIEAMACGCAYVGLRNPMYGDYGMIEGKHYISYDGTVSDLKEKISYYQRHQKELNQIAKTGERFICEMFSEQTVLDNFNSILKKLIKK